MYNLLSIGLGLLAWGFGIAAIVKKGRAGLIFSSFTACGVSLVLQFYGIRGHAIRCDSSWFLDVMPTLAHVAAILLVVTVVLNFAALRRGRGR